MHRNTCLEKTTSFNERKYFYQEANTFHGSLCTSPSCSLFGKEQQACYLTTSDIRLLLVCVRARARTCVRACVCVCCKCRLLLGCVVSHFRKILFFMLKRRISTFVGRLSSDAKIQKQSDPSQYNSATERIFECFLSSSSPPYDCGLFIMCHTWAVFMCAQCVCLFWEGAMFDTKFISVC